MLITCDSKPENIKRDGSPQKISGSITMQSYVGADGPDDDRLYIHNLTTGEWQRVYFPKDPPEPGVSLAPDGYYRIALPLWHPANPDETSPPHDTEDFVFLMPSPNMARGLLRILDS